MADGRHIENRLLAISRRMINGDIALEVLRRCQRASKVISPFIIFAIFDVSFRRYNL